MRFGRLVWVLVFALAVVLSACGQNHDSGDVFVPPTASAHLPQRSHSTATPASPRRKPIHRPTVSCVNNLTFVADLTYPDGSKVPAGRVIDKQWKVKNSGTCNWDGRYRLRRIGGNLSAVNGDEQALYPARSGTEAVIRIRFIAPKKPGPYLSTWQAFDPSGRPFGDPIYIQIWVEKK